MVQEIIEGIGAASLACIAAAQWFRHDPPIIIQPTAQAPIPVNVQVDVPPFPTFPEIPALPPWPSPVQPLVVVKVLPVASEYAVAGFKPSDLEAVQILKKTSDGGYTHVGYRHLDHPDVAASLIDPDLAVRYPDGRLEGVSSVDL